MRARHLQSLSFEEELNNVFPNLTPADCTNVSSGNSVLFRKHLICQFIGLFSGKFCVFNFPYLLFCKPGFTVRNSKSMALLRNHVLNIVSVCSEGKMFWINAGAVIAFMENMHSRRNSPMMNNPGDAMGSLKFSAENKLSVASSMETSFPVPARASLVDVFPESISHACNVVVQNLFHGFNLHRDSFLDTPVELLLGGGNLYPYRSI